MDIDRPSKPTLAQNDQAIADGNQDGCGIHGRDCASIAQKEEQQHDDAREDVADTFRPHVGKGGGVGDGNAESCCSSNWIEQEINAERYDQGGH